MRLLRRNKQQIYYALYEDKESVYDDYGNETGEYELSYTDPKPLMVSVSAANGESVTRQFGNIEKYDRVIITDDMNCPIDENSILWIDQTDTTKPHDYVVKRVARSLNSISYAVSKVNISGEDQDEVDDQEH